MKNSNKSKWPWWMPSKGDFSIIVILLSVLAGLIRYAYKADMDQRAFYAHRAAEAIQRGKYVCIAHGGVAYMTKQYGNGDTNYIAICTDGQRFDNLQNMIQGDR